MALFDYPFVWSQYMLPQHGLTKFLGRFAKSEARLKNTLIKRFIKQYHVDLTEAVYEKPDQYKTFNDFFTRELKPGARPIASEKTAIVSPADGVISEKGLINDDRIIQAKQHEYTLETFLGDADEAKSYQNGDFLTVYLSPKDYHRVHMPFSGRLKRMIYIPGSLFSVNAATTNLVPNLFSRNERVIAFFETEFGNMAVIMVGAMVVGQIVMKWHGSVNHIEQSTQRIDCSYQHLQLDFKKGEEIGHFQLGSTVVVCFESNKIQWEKQLASMQTIKMGEVVAGIKI